MAQPEIVTNDLAAIEKEWLTLFEASLGRTLYPAETESIIARAGAYRESLLRSQMQAAGVQMFTEFAVAPALDYLGKQVGVTRSAAQAAKTTIEFSLTPGHLGTTIPAGTAVGSKDGAAVFLTTQSVSAPSGQNTISVEAVCEEDGTSGNGYSTGFVNKILSPIANVIAASNTTVSGGGVDVETDEKLRERIIASPSSYTTAGSKAAYRFHAISAHPDVVDAVAYPSPAGTVQVKVLVADALPMSPTVQAAVEVALSDEKVRPLCDTVVVSDVTQVTFTDNIELKVYAWAVAGDVSDAVRLAVEDLFAEAKKSIGKDVPYSQRIAAAQSVPGVYSAESKILTVTQVDIPVGDYEVAVGTVGTITITGTVNG